MRRRKVIFFLCLVLGLGIMNYPFVRQFLNRQTQRSLVTSYKESVEQMEEEEILAKKQAYQEYNEALRHDKQATLDLHEQMLGVIHIPKIDVMLPVYYQTSQDVLNKGVGIVEGMSIPIGGEGTHAVLMAHSGLPTQTLFTDLDQLALGDTFEIDILDEKLYYEVVQIEIVEPHELEQLSIDMNQDQVTLVTCTPYGLNTHRLLVIARRTAAPLESETSLGWYALEKAIFAISIVVLITAIFMLWKPFKKERRHDRVI